MDAQSQGNASTNTTPTLTSNSLSIFMIADTPENDLQSAAFELSKVSIPIFHRPRLGKAFARISWFGNEFNARGS